MTRASAFAFIVIAATASLAEPGSKELGELFERYVTATSEKRGGEAASLLAPSALAAFDEIRQLALDGSREALSEKPFFIRLEAILVRQLFSRERLEALSGAGLFEALVSQGHVAGDPSNRLAVGAVDFQGSTATLHIDFEGKPTPFRMGAIQIDSQWRVDPLAFMHVAADALKARAVSNGITADEFIRRTAGVVVGRELGEEIWTPLRPPPR